jgi:hypothetical protein
MGIDITGLGSVFTFGTAVIDKLFPDKDAADKAKLEMLRLQQEGAFKELELQFENAKSQTLVNIEEAKSGGLLNKWRGGVGWVCVLAYAYNYFFMPLLAWGAKWLDPAGAPPMIALETGDLTTLLLGMLGLGGMRVYEKVKGVASK